MANQIRMAPDELHMQADLLRECSERLSDDGIRIQHLLETVLSAWSGEALSACICGIESEMSSIQILRERLYELSNIIENAACSLEATESQIASLFKE